MADEAIEEVGEVPMADDLVLFVEEETQAEVTVLSYKWGPSHERFAPRRLHRDPKAQFRDDLRDVEAMRTHERLAKLGAEIFEELIPAELARKLRAVRATAKTLKVVSNETWIPWEILCLDPDAPDPAATLAHTFHLTRQLEGWEPPASLTLDRLALVAPRQTSLQGADTERELLLSLDACEVEEIPAHLEPIVDAMKSGEFHGWHFTGHGLDGGESSRHWALLLEEPEKLQPFDLRGTNRLGGTAPLVFLNACHSGHGAPSLSGPGGLISAFLDQGAGAVIGSRWAVDDAAALLFARELYRRFLDEGETIGEAVHGARLKLRQEFPNDPAWLAYTVFAHPLARRRRASYTMGIRSTEARAPEKVPLRRKDESKRPPDPRSAKQERPKKSRETASGNRTVILAALITAVATLIAAVLTRVGSPEVEEGQVLVRVADRSGAGIRGAEVILFAEGGPYQSTTDSLGAAQVKIRLKDDAVGQLVAQAPGHEVTERTIHPLREPVVTLQLPPRSSETAHVLFRVVDAAGGEPVSQAEVLLLLGADPYVQVTDSHGLVRFQVDFFEGKTEAELSVTTEEFAIEHQRITLLPDKVQDVALDRRARTLSSVEPGEAVAAVDRGEIGQRLRRGQQWIADGFPDKARAELEGTREQDPSNPEVFLALAALEEWEGNVGKAEERYRQALDLAPEGARCHHQLGNFLLSRHDFEEALRHLGKATELDPKDATVWNDLGLAYLEWGLSDEARSSFERGLGLLAENVPISPDVESKLRKNLGRTLIEVGEAERAIPYLVEALRKHNSDARFRFEADYLLARAYAATGQGRESCRYLADLFHRKGSYSEWGSAGRELAQEQGCVMEQEDSQ